MTQQTNSEEARIKAVLENLADAVRRYGLPDILAHHEQDMVVLDLPPPTQCKGITAYAQKLITIFEMLSEYAQCHLRDQRHGD